MICVCPLQRDSYLFLISFASSGFHQLDKTSGSRPDNLNLIYITILWEGACSTHACVAYLDTLSAHSTSHYEVLAGHG